MVGRLVFVAALSVSSRGAAQAEPRASLVVIRGDGARDCPDADALAERVRAVAGTNVIGVGSSASPIETWVQVAISHDFAGYNAQISTFGRRHGTRALEDLGPSCASLADAVAVTLAMFLDPYETPPSSSPRPEPVAKKRSPEPKAPATSAARESRFFIDGAAGLTFNLLEHSEPFLGVGLGFRPSARWSVALGGTFVLPDSKVDGSRSVDLRLSFAFLQVCALALGHVDRASLAWCAAPQVGSLASDGRGYQNNFAEHSLWLALGIGPEAAFRLTHSLSWVFGAEAVIPLLEQGFDVQSNGVRSSAYRTPSVAALVSLGLRGHL